MTEKEKKLAMLGAYRGALVTLIDVCCGCRNCTYSTLCRLLVRDRNPAQQLKICDDEIKQTEQS